MLGLTALEHKVKPGTTLEKIFFLVEFGFTGAHYPTFIVSACALGALVMLRLLKASLRRFKWVARVPEVLLVVIVSTRTFLFPVSLLLAAQRLQFYRMSSVGTMITLTSSARYRSTQVATSSNSLSTTTTCDI
jgi:hypothetical protein